MSRRRCGAPAADALIDLCTGGSPTSQDAPTPIQPAVDEVVEIKVEGAGARARGGGEEGGGAEARAGEGVLRCLLDGMPEDAIAATT